MKVGVNLAVELKEESLKRGANFSDLLMEYMMEDILDKVYSGKYGDKMWLITDALGEAKCDGHIGFYFSNEKGDLSQDIVERILEDICKSQEVSWIYNLRQEEAVFTAEMIGEYREMQVPLAISVYNNTDTSIKPRKKEWERILKPTRSIEYWEYSPESRMGECLYEIMNKLELISDMEAYYLVNDTLKHHSVSTRQIVEEINCFTSNNKKALKEKRIEIIKGYKEYSYMKKRWNQYCKHHNLEGESWEEVLERIISFAEPVWKAICRNEVFFDDWMPELGRFLG